MKKYKHRVVGIYATHAAAKIAVGQLVEQGISPSALTVLAPGRDEKNRETRADSDDVLNEMLRDGAVGTAAGALAGAGGTIALSIANAGLFIASPVLGTLIMLGWGASIGGFLGAVEGAQGRDGDVADLVRDALASGHAVLIAHTANEEQTTAAQRILGESMRVNGVEATPG